MSNIMNRASQRIRGIAVAALSAALMSCFGIDIDTQFAQDENIHAAIIEQNADRYAEVDPLYISNEVKQLVDSYIHPRDGDEARIDKLQDILNIQVSRHTLLWKRTTRERATAWVL
jgi:hypothetical protein